MNEKDRENVAIITQRASSYDPVIRGEIDYLVGNLDLLDKENEWLKQKRESLEVSLRFRAKTEALLDKQLTEIKEAGEPFRLFYETNDLIHLPSNCGLVWRQKGTEVMVDNFRRLAEALKEVNGE